MTNKLFSSTNFYPRQRDHNLIANDGGNTMVLNENYLDQDFADGKILANVRPVSEEACHPV